MNIEARMKDSWSVKCELTLNCSGQILKIDVGLISLQVCGLVFYNGRKTEKDASESHLTCLTLPLSMQQSNQCRESRSLLTFEDKNYNEKENSQTTLTNIAGERKRRTITPNISYSFIIHCLGMKSIRKFYYPNHGPCQAKLLR